MMVITEIEASTPRIASSAAIILLQMDTALSTSANFCGGVAPLHRSASQPGWKRYVACYSIRPILRPPRRGVKRAPRVIGLHVHQAFDVSSSMRSMRPSQVNRDALPVGRGPRHLS